MTRVFAVINGEQITLEDIARAKAVLMRHPELLYEGIEMTESTRKRKNYPTTVDPNGVKTDVELSDDQIPTVENEISSVMDMAKSQRELADQIQQAIDENNTQMITPVGFDSRLFQIQLTFLEMHRDSVLANRFGDASSLYENILIQADRFYQVLKDHV